MDWKYNNPRFHISKPKNKLTWGLHSAIVHRYNKGEIDDQPRIEITFYYHDKVDWNEKDKIEVQTYTQKGKISESFLTKAIDRHFNSKKLDKIMYGNALPDFREL